MISVGVVEEASGGRVMVTGRALGCFGLHWFIWVLSCDACDGLATKGMFQALSVSIEIYPGVISSIS